MSPPAQAGVCQSSCRPLPGRPQRGLSPAPGQTLSGIGHHPQDSFNQIFVFTVGSHNLTLESVMTVSRPPRPASLSLPGSA